jgi:hypothetical protein
MQTKEQQRFHAIIWALALAGLVGFAWVVGQ